MATREGGRGMVGAEGEEGKKRGIKNDTEA